VKDALVALALALVVVPCAAAFGAIDHPHKVAAVDQPRELGTCYPVGERVDENGRTWVFVRCPESEAWIVHPKPDPKSEAREP